MRYFLIFFSVLLLLFCGSFTVADSPTYDIVIRDGKILDGTGNPWYYADVGIVRGKIAAIGTLKNADARVMIDARGLYVAPGFIDVHSHADHGLATEELSSAIPLITQGITTVIVNQDGGGPVDIARQRNALMEHGLGVNVAQLIGHGSVRREVMGMDDRAPTSRELDEMKELVRRAMEDGAFGLSTGLFYAPGSYADTDELIELAKVVSEYDGVHISHVRDEGGYTIGVLASIDETIEVSRSSGVRGAVTHIKAFGPREWGLSKVMIHRIQRARDEGIEIFADQYPYTAAGGSIAGILIPRWALAGGRDALMERLRNPEKRELIKNEIMHAISLEGGAERIQFTNHPPDPTIEGKTMAQIARERNIEPVELALKLLEAGDAAFVTFGMIEEDIKLFMKQPWVMTSSDGGLVTMGEGLPHPRNYGSFPRKIRKYVIEQGVIDLPFAIRSMTSLSATVCRIPGRGLLHPGYVADIVILDKERISDLATYTDPHQLSEGIVYVLINGEFVIKDEEFTGALPGKVLLRGN